MKSFIKHISIFVLPIILFAYPLDLLISNNLKKSHDYYGELEVWNAIYKGNINSKNLIYGSSRAWVGINPQILADTLQTSVYNLGIDGHNFWLQYLRHLEYLENNKLPKQIILAVDFGSLQKRKTLYLYEQFLPYMLWNKNITKYTKSYIGFNYFDYYVPLKRYIGKPNVLKNAFYLGLSNNKDSFYRTLGYKGIEKKWTNEFEIAKNTISSYKVSIDTESVALFDTFLLECKKNNINVVIVYTPEFIEAQKFIKNREEILDIYKLHAKKHDVPFLDYSKNSLNYDKQYFYNATHLNKTGANLFSEILANDLKKLN
jgi:hypothetical protein